MNESKRIQWENERKKGMLKHVAFNGILLFALPSVIVWLFIIPLVDGRGFSFFTTKEFFKDIPITLIIYVLVGIVFTTIGWIINEYRYKKGKG